MKRKTLRVSVITLCLLLSITVGFTSSVNVKADEEVKIYETKISTNDTEKIEAPVVDNVNQDKDQSHDLENEKTVIDETYSQNKDEVTNIEDEEVTTEFELKSNEALVGSFDEFRTLVRKQGNGTIDTYYMTADFTADKGFSIPSGYSFTLDGKNPYTQETHTYTQTVAMTSDYSGSLNTSGTASMSIEFRNMNIVGSSKKGIIYSFSNSATQRFDNVVFEGPALSYNHSGKTMYHDSTLTNTVADYTSYMHSGKNLELSGTTHVYGAGKSALYVFLLSDGSLIIKENANVTIEHSTRVAATSYFEMEKGSTLTIEGKYIQGGNVLVNTIEAKKIVINDASLNINGEKGLNGSAALYGEVIEIENSEVNINVYNQTDIIRAKNLINFIESSLELNANHISYGYMMTTEPNSIVNVTNSDINESVVTMAGTGIDSRGEVLIDNSKIVSGATLLRTDYIRATNKISIKNNSFFKMKVDGVQSTIISSNYIIVENSVVNIEIIERATSSKNQDLIKGKHVLIDGANMNILINDSDIKYIFDVSETLTIKDSNCNPGEFHMRSTFPIGFSKNVNATITIDTQQVNVSQLLTENDYQLHFRKNEYKPGKMVFKVDINGMPSFIYNDFNDAGLPNPEDYLNLNSLRSISIGTIGLEYVVPLSQENVSFKTNVDADVEFIYNGDTYVYDKADADGLVNLNLDPKAKPGLHNLNIVSNGLIRKDIIDFTSFGTVSLTSYPQDLDFSSLTMPKGHTEYQPTNKSQITVEDTRVEKTGWKLEVRVKTPLHQQNNKTNEFTNALIFRNPINHNKNVLSSKPVLVYETNELYDEEVNIEFGEMEGILLEFYGANGIYAGANYDASLEWILTQY